MVVIIVPTAVEIWKRSNCVTLNKREWRALLSSRHVIDQCIAAGSDNRIMLVKRGSDDTSSHYVTVENFRDEMYIDIRKWYVDADGSLLPTRQGARLNRRQWEELTTVCDYANRTRDAPYATPFASAPASL